MLRAVDITVHYDLDPLFEHVDLTLGPGDRLGLVGPNGTGKSSLLRILAGQQRPARGHVVRSPGLVVGHQAQEVTDPGMTVADFVAGGAPELAVTHERMRALESVLASSAGADRAIASAGGLHRDLVHYEEAVTDFEVAGGWSALARAEDVRSRLGVATTSGIDGTRLLASLSGGEQSRVMLARLLVGEPDVLLLDEPTNHLDLEGRHWLEEHLRGYRGAVLVVSHDRRFLDRVVTQVIELDGIRMVLQDYPGCGYTAYRQERQRRWERLVADHAAQEQYRARLAEDIERTKEQARGVEVANPRNPGARRLAKKVARKALSRERRLERQMRSASWIAEPQTRPELVLGFAQPAVPPGTTLLDLPELTVRAGGRTLLRAGRLRLSAGERVLVTGNNGVGKSSLLRHLLPLLPDASLLPQTHDHLPGGTSTIDYFRSLVPLYVDEAEQVLDGFLFDEDDRQRALRDLSVGQVRRLLLAAMVNLRPAVLVLDEPTNHLDFDALDVVEAALEQYTGTLLLVSHDEALAERVGLTRRWHLGAGRLEQAA
jgi:ATPase subunit of ABC transporter with duplicated ATPase domains